mmetsp:Transcript_5797/g.7707  ORF Transcript_5797/g.7707 Transcript_5797/m.7707 type:complete len:204 (+) Transcript_5797:1761-2372(+)
MGQNFSLLIDYADSPEGIVNLIGSIYESCFIKTILIISGKSSFSANENRLFLKYLLDSSKKLFLTTNNPKWFSNKSILNEVLMGLPNFIKYSHSGSVYDWFFDVHKIPLWFEYWFYKYQDDLGCYVIDDRDLALKICLSMAGKEDVVLVTGRGDDDFFLSLSDNNKLIVTPYNEIVNSYKILRQLSSLYNIPIKTGQVPWTTN